MTYTNETKELFMKSYKDELEHLLEGLDEKYRPTPTRLHEIIENSAKYLDVDDLLDSARTVEDGTGIKLLWDPKRDACIALTIAAAAALVAAWVASGGTLVVGTAVAGIIINSPILAALVGGLTGAALAGVICDNK